MSKKKCVGLIAMLLLSLSILVAGCGGNTITAAAPEGKAEIEPNDDPMTAQVITVGQTINASTSCGGNSGNTDFYSITPTETAPYKIAISFGSTGDLDLFVLDSGMTLRNSSVTQANGGSEIIIHTLTSGSTYYIMVTSSNCSATTSYTLAVH